MDRQTLSSPQRGSLSRLALYCALLALAIAPPALVIAAIASGGISPAALLRAAVAGGLCWLAAALGLTVTHFGNVFRSPVQGLLGGMLLRMGLPLAGIVALPQLGGAFAAAGLTGTILGVYLVTLVLETALALRMVPLAPRAAQAT